MTHPVRDWVALGDVTSNGSVIFAKNSDRPIFDCQPLRFVSRTSWPPNTMLQLEYLAIPQVPLTTRRLVLTHTGAGAMKQVSMNMASQSAMRRSICVEQTINNIN